MAAVMHHCTLDISFKFTEYKIAVLLKYCEYKCMFY